MSDLRHDATVNPLFKKSPAFSPDELLADINFM
jgi:hypothetical protein